jgi:two-component system osmolarity sensor histidine kinase EnvZ
MLLSLLGAWLIVFRITRPLKALQQAAREVGAGATPARLDEGGPTELATVAHAFNQMSADLAQHRSGSGADPGRASPTICARR